MTALNVQRDDVLRSDRVRDNELQIETISSLDWVEAIVKVRGTLDDAASQALLREVTRVRQNGAARILFDLSGVLAIEPPGVEVLLHIRRQMHYEEGVFGVVGIGDAALASLRQAGAAELLGC